MKKFIGLTALVLFMMVGCFSSFAQKSKEEYTVYYVDLLIDSGYGKAVVEWQGGTKSTSYKVQLLKSSSKNGHETTVLEKKCKYTVNTLDVTKAIASNGTGYYRAAVVPEKAALEFAVSETLYVDTYILKQLRGSSQDDVTTTGWVRQNNGTWNYYRPNGTMAANCWELINGVWYRFNDFGDMLTGWQWVRGADGIQRCYYMDPNGACQLGGVTPDGYTVDENGAWTMNGIVQVKY